MSQIIVCGMGASWLGAHIMQGLVAQNLKVPLLVNHDYHIPSFVGNETLFIASSYSGTTEEVVNALDEAYKKGAKIITISSGGTLYDFAKEHNLPSYTYTPTHNPAKSPRLGLGYSIVAQMIILEKLGLVSFDRADLEQAISHLKKQVQDLGVENTQDNEAKEFAQKLQGVIPIICAGTFLLGVAHTFSNQVNETSKTFATFMHIPELNHHNMEGLAHPAEVQKLKYVFLQSDLYDKRVQTRFDVTKEVVEQNKISHLTYTPKGTTKLSQAFDVLLFGSFVTFYLAMIYGVDPSPNPYVDYFKKRLKELSG